MAKIFGTLAALLVAIIAALAVSERLQGLQFDEEMPHIGDHPEWGYMNVFEWDGE